MMKPILLFLFPSVFAPFFPAHAYIDPNTGGSIFQVLFPILSACAAAYIVFRNRVKKFFEAVMAFIRKKR